MRVAFEAECGVGKGADCGSSSCTGGDGNCDVTDDASPTQDAGTSMQSLSFSRAPSRQRVERAQSLPTLASMTTMPTTSSTTQAEFGKENEGAIDCDTDNEDTSSTVPWYAP